jgi:hypothetical protein
MSAIPSEAQKIEVEQASVDFYKLSKDGESTYYFDTSKCGPPEPMVNAVAGLKLIKGTNDKLVMINHKMPMGLFKNLQDDINYESQEIEGGLVAVTFSNNASASNTTDLQNINH